MRYFEGSSAALMDCAERTEISCSPERPPKTSATEIDFDVVGKNYCLSAKIEKATYLSLGKWLISKSMRRGYLRDEIEFN
jgi:hypothetical protein